MNKLKVGGITYIIEKVSIFKVTFDKNLYRKITYGNTKKCSIFHKIIEKKLRFLKKEKRK